MSLFPALVLIALVARWLVSSQSGQAQATQTTNVTLPMMIWAVGLVLTGVFVAVAEGPAKLAALPVLATPGLALIARGALARRGSAWWVYYLTRLFDYRWGNDARSGAIYLSALALRNLRASSRRQKIEGSLRRRLARVHRPILPVALAARAALEIPPNDRERLRSLYLFILLFPPLSRGRRLGQHALEWLTVEALERGDLDEARIFSSGRFPSFFHGPPPRSFLRRKLSMEDILAIPERNPWSEATGLRRSTLPTTPLLRDVYSKLTGQRRASGSHRVPESLDARIATLMLSSEGSASLKGETNVRAGSLSSVDLVELEARLTRWASHAGAGQEDIESCLAQLLDEAATEAAETPAETEALQRMLDRLGALAQDLEAEVASASEEARRVAQTSFPARTEVRLWTVVKRWIDIDRLYREVRVLGEFEGEAYELEVYDEVRSAVMSAAADLWNEHQQYPLAFAMFTWCGMEAFRVRDPHGLTIALQNVGNGKLVLC